MEFQKFDASKFDQGSINSMILSNMIQLNVITSLLIDIKAKLDGKSLEDVTGEVQQLLQMRTNDFKSSVLAKL
jgi:hypothetical protein